MATVLMLGSRGTAVRKLQDLLNDAGASPRVDVNGVFDDETDTAVRAVQRRLQLVIDGKAGTQTMTALRQAVAPVKPGKAEPNKEAMAQSVIRLQVPGNDNIAAPPNVASLKLLDTARFIDEIIIHCTATAEGKNYTIADIRAWHKARGFTDIGYHYVIARDGRVLIGRPIGQVGAHVAGHNTGTIGISYIGGVTADGKTPKDTRTAAQRATLLWLTRALAKKHGVRKVTGHNQYAAKACPSFDVRKDALGKIAA